MERRKLIKRVKRRGRPPGSKNRFTMKMLEEARRTGDLPHEILLKISRGEPITEVRRIRGKDNRVWYKRVQMFPTLDQRMTAANMCANYFAPKLKVAKPQRPITRLHFDVAALANLPADRLAVLESVLEQLTGVLNANSPPGGAIPLGPDERLLEAPRARANGVNGHEADPSLFESSLK